MPRRPRRRHTRAGVSGVKVFPLYVGATKVPFGQFYGGLEGWTGLRGVWRMATAEAMIEVPIYAYLIVHPEAGAILFDAGISQAQVREHDRYYRGPFAFGLSPDEYTQAPEQALPAQLERLGYRPEDVSAIVLSHLYEDHVGALEDFPEATVLVSQAEWEARFETVFLGVRPLYYHASLANIRRWHLVPFTSGARYSFGSSQDLLGDGSLVLLPTPGDTAGHASLLVQTDGYRLLLAGDALYTLRHLDVQAMRPLISGGSARVAQYETSVGRIRVLQEVLPNLVVIPTHDHYTYPYQLVVPALTDGRLSPRELDAIHEHVGRLFDARGSLREAARPRFLPGQGSVGRVDARLP